MVNTQTFNPTYTHTTKRDEPHCSPTATALDDAFMPSRFLGQESRCNTLPNAAHHNNKAKAQNTQTSDSSRFAQAACL